MGLLDDAIREHLDLKRRRGADPAEIERAEREALGPVRREPLASEAGEPERLDLAGDALDQPALDELHPDLGELHPDLGEVEPLDLGAEPHHDTPAAKRHGSGGRSLFGRLRRGGEAEHADDEAAPEPLGHEEVHRPPSSAGHEEESWDQEYGFEEEDDPLGQEPPHHEGPGTVAFHPPSEWEKEEPTVAGDPGATHPEAPEPSVPPPHRAEPHEPAGPSPARQADPGETVEYHVGSEPDEEPEPRRPPAEPADHAAPDEDVLEETPEFLQDTPDHDRLWFEQRPPRDFDFDG